MALTLKEEARELLSRMSSIEARTALLQKGYLEQEVDGVLNDAERKNQSSEAKRTNRILATKESLDRVGYGFASPQFINILFMQSGAGFLLIGLASGIKALVSLILSSTLREYEKSHTISKDTIANAGLIYGFSFFLLAFATLAQLPWLFIFAFILGAIGVVTYGDLYQQVIQAMIKHEKKSYFLQKSATYGILISLVSLLLSGLIIDKVPGNIVTIGVLDLKVYGFLISFMLTAFAIILSSFFMSKLADHREQRQFPFREFFRGHVQQVIKNTKMFMRNRYVALMLIPATLNGILQLLGTTFYGIFIYQMFKHSMFEGFLNIAILYAVAMFASLFGQYFAKTVHKSTGLAPHLVFGTLLSAILPFVLVFNPQYFAIMAGLVCSVIGGAVSGSAQGLITQKIMDSNTRKAFYSAQVFVIAIPYIILVPIGAWIASTFGLEVLFTIVGFGLALVVAPLYFLLVAITNKLHI